MQNKFETLQPWLKTILNAIKKDIKYDYLPGDKAFYKTYFGTRPINRLTPEEIFGAFEKELLAGGESCAEWVVNRWVFKHGELYDHFAEKLSQIRPDFSELTELTEAESRQVLAGTEPFGVVETYLFARLNAVVFPASIFEELKDKAQVTQERQEEEASAQKTRESFEQIIERQQREIARLEEKIESKVSGVLRKYTADTEALKKQIRALQQKIHA